MENEQLENINEFKVKAGDTFLIEIEFTKDIDLVNEPNVFSDALQKIDKKPINDLFIINSLIPNIGGFDSLGNFLSVVLNNKIKETLDVLFTKKE